MSDCCKQSLAFSLY